MKIARWYPSVAATLALVVALTGVGAAVAGKLQLKIGSKQIKNNTIKAVDLRKNAVTPKKAKFPPAEQINPASPRGATASDTGSAPGGPQYSLAATLGTFTKEDPSSKLQVTWIGSARADSFTACVFQLRVDGQPPAAGGAEVFVNNGNVLSVTVQGLFDAGAGQHAVQVYARGTNPSAPCIVGPDQAQVRQTVNVAELVE